MSTEAMSIVPRGHAAKREFWRTMIAQWRESGQAQVEFCAERGLSIKALSRWRTRLGPCIPASPPRSAQGNEFLPLRLSAAVSEVEVLLANGHRVRLSGVHAERLVSRLLERLSC